jgi:ribonuclease G
LITEVLHEGQQLTVQVMKDMMGSKGARLTTDLSIPSRYLVYMPNGEHIGVSQRIEDEAERDRLKHLIRQLRRKAPDTEAGGFIVRTAAEGVSEHDLRRDMQFLVKLWRWAQERCASAGSPSLIYEELPLFLAHLAGSGERRMSRKS